MEFFTSNRFSFIEVIFVVILAVLSKLKFKDSGNIFVIVTIGVFIVEIILSGFKNMGINFSTITKGIVDNIGYIILVSIIIQSIYILFSKLFLPEYIEFLKNRLPVLINTSQLVNLLISLFIGTFIEEMIYRGVLQNKLCNTISPFVSIILISLLFAFMHYAKGNFNIQSFDLIGVFIDSIIYGLIFFNTNNLFVSWIAHFSSDVIASILILFLF